MPSVWAFSSSS